jgi:hypothetical protein
MGAIGQPKMSLLITFRTGWLIALEFYAPTAWGVVQVAVCEKRRHILRGIAVTVETEKTALTMK